MRGLASLTYACIIIFCNLRYEAQMMYFSFLDKLEFMIFLYLIIVLSSIALSDWREVLCLVFFKERLGDREREREILREKILRGGVERGYFGK